MQNYQNWPHSIFWPHDVKCFLMKNRFTFDFVPLNFLIFNECMKVSMPGRISCAGSQGLLVFVMIIKGFGQAVIETLTAFNCAKTKRNKRNCRAYWHALCLPYTFAIVCLITFEFWYIEVLNICYTTSNTCCWGTVLYCFLRARNHVVYLTFVYSLPVSREKIENFLKLFFLHNTKNSLNFYLKNMNISCCVLVMSGWKRLFPSLAVSWKRIVSELIRGHCLL